jgi:hypothetical protein
MKKVGLSRIEYDLRVALGTLRAYRTLLDVENDPGGIDFGHLREVYWNEATRRLENLARDVGEVLAAKTEGDG